MDQNSLELGAAETQSISSVHFLLPSHPTLPSPFPRAVLRALPQLEVPLALPELLVIAQLWEMSQLGDKAWTQLGTWSGQQERAPQVTNQASSALRFRKWA